MCDYPSVCAGMCVVVWVRVLVLFFVLLGFFLNFIRSLHCVYLIAAFKLACGMKLAVYVLNSLYSFFFNRKPGRYQVHP